METLKPTSLKPGDKIRRIGAYRALTFLRRERGEPWPRLRWRDDRGKTGFCYVRNAHDARDPLFDQLPPRSRARIARAVAAMEA